MSDSSSVSCLMPTKNRRAFIPRAIAMFLAQDYPGNAELIIVEDGDENCEDLAFQAQFMESGHVQRLGSRIIYKRFEGTLGAKLNEAARTATGEICINWDDDDFHAPNRVSTQVAHMQLTGKPVVGFSSLIYYAEGRDFGYEYTGDAWYASGSSHCYRRDWVLAHPRPDMTVGEDNHFAEHAHRHDAISNISGLKCLVACDHPNNCSGRGYGTEWYELVRETSDNFRKVPLSEFAAAIGPHASH